MSTYSAYDAKTHFSALLELASDGETVTITKHGRPVAKLVPIDPTPAASELAATLLEARNGVRLGDLSVADLVEEGRRY